MLEIVLTREDANTEYALLAEWLVEDRAEVTAGQPVCVVETTKATVEVESPGAGTIVQLYGEDVEVELGKTIAYVAESADELAVIDEKGQEKPTPKPAAGDRKATRKAVELAELHGIDLSAIEKRGFITEKDVEELLAAQKASGAPAADPALAGVSTDGVSLPLTFDPDGTSGALEPSSYELLVREESEFRALSSAEKVRRLREYGAVVGDDVDLGDGSYVVAPRIVISDAVRLGARATIVCEEAFAVGSLTQFGADLELRCRRAYLGSGIWGGRSVRFGGGGHRDPWATLGDRRPRVRRRRGVRQRLPAGAHRARGVPDDAVADRDAQHRPLGARGLREPLRAGRARGPLAGRARRRALRRRRGSAPRRSSRRTRTSWARSLRVRSPSAFPRRRPGARATSSPTRADWSSPDGSSTTSTSCSRSAVTRSRRSRTTASRSKVRASRSRRATAVVSMRPRSC